MKKRILTVLTVFALSLSACASDEYGQKEQYGTVVGGVLGGVLGAQIGDGRGQVAAAALGAMLGSILGSEVGKSLDKADLAYANQAFETAHDAPVGETIAWNNPESGNSGTYKPVRDGYADGGEYCREYQQTIIIDGRQEIAYGTACQNPDGSWQII